MNDCCFCSISNKFNIIHMHVTFMLVGDASSPQNAPLLEIIIIFNACLIVQTRLLMDCSNVIAFFRQNDWMSNCLYKALNVTVNQRIIPSVGIFKEFDCKVTLL